MADHGSISKAAEALFVSQPAISLQIKKLESELGFSLLYRTAQGVSLTPAGEEEDAREWDIPVDSPEEELADRIGLAEAMQALPEKDRLLLTLRFYRGKTQSETAAVLGTTQVQISRRERKLLSKLRAMLLQG